MQKPLPLPPLEQTLDKFLKAIEPVFDKELNQQAVEITHLFLHKHGEILQQKLSDYAEQQVKTGKSWVSDFWLKGYLAGRQSKALSSNVGFQIQVPETIAKTGMSRPAQLIHYIVLTHRNFIDKRIEPLKDNRGNDLSMDGWQTLKGAMRHPQPECDAYYYCDQGMANRHINLFWQGHHYVLPVTDSEGNVFSIQAIEEALSQLSKTSNLKDNNGMQQPTVELAFTELSALPSVDACKQLDELCKNEYNNSVYQSLKDSLFCFSLYHSGEDELVQLQRQTFLPAHAWQYKPFTYQMDLDSEYMTVHVEHTGLDGGTINNILADAFVQSEVHETEQSTELQLLDWQMSDEQTQHIIQLLNPVKENAEQFKIQKFTVDYSSIKTKVSHDAIFQFSLIYAQLKVFKQLKNTYEAVDTSNFLAGRTECLRPNTMPAKALAEKLLLNIATEEDLAAAFLGHKSWVIDCKTGQAIDRHLFALQEICLQEENCNDETSQRFFELVNQFAGKDFLSTSTIGSQSPIRRFVFAPTSQGGFGVNYSMNHELYEFCLIADSLSANQLDEMQQAIQEGAQKIINLIGGE